MNALKRRRVATAPQIATHLWTNILGFVGPATWMEASKVNAQFKTASKADVLWSRVYRQLEFGAHGPQPYLKMAVLDGSVPSGVRMVERTPKQAVLQFYSFCPGCEQAISKRSVVAYSSVCGASAHEESAGWAGDYQTFFVHNERKQCDFFSEKWTPFARVLAPERRESTVRGVWGRPVCPTCAGTSARVMSKTAVAKHCKVSVKRLDASDLPRFTVGRSVFFAVSHVQGAAAPRTPAVDAN